MQKNKYLDTFSDFFRGEVGGSNRKIRSKFRFNLDFKISQILDFGVFW